MKKRTTQELGEAIANNDPDLYFCRLPFSQIYSDNAGRWRLCCRAQPFDFEHTIWTATPRDHWLHPAMQEVRREMLSGKLKTAAKLCSKCLRQEKAGGTSARQQINAKIVKQGGYEKRPFLRSAAAMTETGNYRLKERVLELKLRIFGNYCNLACYMCAPVNSTTRLQELKQIRDGAWIDYMHAPERPQFFETEKQYNKFVRQTLRLLPYVQKIKITGGEPFLLRRHHEFLQEVVKSGHGPAIKIAYDSNMTKFKLGSSNVLDYLKDFQRVTLSVSVDNLRERNDYIRFGSKFDEIIANIEIAREYPNVNVDVSCATGVLNAGDVVDVAEFFDKIGLNAKFNMCVIDKPVFAQARHLPDALKREYIRRIEESPCRDRLDNVLRMLNQPRDEKEWQTFIRYQTDLDNLRGTSFLKLYPEFEPHIGEAAAV